MYKLISIGKCDLAAVYLWFLRLVCMLTQKYTINTATIFIVQVNLTSF